jgi:hypothetical protein
MVNRDLKEITILALQEEEESALQNYINQDRVPSSEGLTFILCMTAVTIMTPR